MQLRGACLGLALLAAPQGAQAAADAGTAKAILMRSVAFRTVQGAGQVPKLAAYYADVLRQAGFAEEDIVITPMGETATFAATIKGRDAALKPLLMIGHMDVVEADPKDWTRDPFVPVEENGYIFGRGAEDNKYDVAMMVATLAQLKKEGWTPRRTVTLLLSGDEETDMATTRALAARYKDAEMLLNGDGGGGLLNEAGEPVLYQLQAGEKTYADFEIGFTDAGGHSSAPTPGNPIYKLAKAIDRIAAYEFPAMRNELTQASLALSADRIGAAAMRCAAILSGLTREGVEVDRTGRSGPVVEVYPAAALKLWDLPHQGYKGREAANARRRAALVQLIEGALPWLNLGEHAEICAESDDALDSVLCAAIAGLALRGQIAEIPSEHHEAAAVEGWIALPARH